MAVVIRDWFDWSGWIATILGTALAVGQLIYAAIKVRRIKRQNRQPDVKAEAGQISSAKDSNNRSVLTGPPLWLPLLRALFWIAIYQPLLAGLAATIVLGDVPRSGPYVPTVLTHTERYQVNAAGLVLMLIIGSMWAWGAWRFYKRLRENNRGWLIVPIAGALTTGGFALIIAVFTRLGLDWISMLYTYRVVNYMEILERSHSRLQAIAIVLFTWNGLSLSYAWLWVAIISWAVVLVKVAMRLARHDR